MSGSTSAAEDCGCLLQASLVDDPRSLPRKVPIECRRRPAAAEPGAGKVDERL